MADKAALKREGLAFATSLQSLLRTVGMYSVDHPAAERVLQQAFNQLHALLKQTREFTLGFVNQRLLLNQTLTSEGAAGPLAAEFSRRGIGAVTFGAGISLREFKRAVALISTRPKTIEEGGGIRRMLEQNPIEGIRILPARKQSEEDADTELQVDAQSYITAQAILDAPFTGGSSAGAAGGRPEGVGGTASPSEIMLLSRQAVRAALTDPEKDLGNSMEVLARWLATLTPEGLVSALPEPRRGDLNRLPHGEAARELVEDETAEWAGSQLAKSGDDAAAKIAEAEVIQGLLRGVQATLAAERLLQKLERVITEAGLPHEVYERIRREVMWHSLTRKEKHAELLRMERFSDTDFRRLMAYLHEAMNAEGVQDALQLARHYWSHAAAAPEADRAAELARLPELMNAMAGPQTLGFMQEVAAWVLDLLMADEASGGNTHPLAAQGLNSISQNAARFEEFKLVQAIGAGLKRSSARDKSRHQGCCGKALNQLVSPATAHRLVERYLEERENAAWARTVIAMLRWIGTAGADVVFKALEEENAAANRMRLIRLLVLVGDASIDAATKRLRSDKWYVVRNACFVLGSLSTPNLPVLLGGTLRHPDPRVQQAALTSILKCHLPGRGPILAAALCDLKSPGLEMALDELMFLKAPEASNGLARFVLQSGKTNQSAAETAIRILASHPSEQAVQVLQQILRDSSQPLSLRRVALGAMSASPLASVQRILSDFSQLDRNDPCVKECRTILGLPA